MSNSFAGWRPRWVLASFDADCWAGHISSYEVEALSEGVGTKRGVRLNVAVASPFS
jgi:hypothetical protein